MNPTTEQVSGTGRIGFRIRTDPPRPDPAIVERLRGIEAANVADAMGRFRFMDPGIRSRSGRPLCGPAVTVNTRPGDNLMVHKALEIAKPGDVIVVNTNGDTTSAVFGELMCHSAVGAHLGGIVVDGAVRDVDGITELGFPSFSRTVSPGSGDKDGPGEINYPIACGNVVVMPGDIVIGDSVGVVVVPLEDAEEVAAAAEAIVEKERQRVGQIKEGVLFMPVIDKTLREEGVIS